MPSACSKKKGAHSAGCGLVEEQECRVRRDLDADVDALELATGDASLLGIADSRMLYIIEVENTKTGLSNLHPLVIARRRRQPQSRRILKILTHSQVSVHSVELPVMTKMLM